ncbi:hypothetical protein D3C86_1892170 [compost metagenome]
MFTHASVMQVAFGRQVHHLLMALDGGVDTVDFRRVVVVLLLVVGVPVGARVVVQQGAGFLGQRVAALPLGLKIESHNVVSFSRKKPPEGGGLSCVREPLTQGWPRSAKTAVQDHFVGL